MKGEKCDLIRGSGHISCVRVKMLVALGHEVDHKLSSHP